MIYGGLIMIINYASGEGSIIPPGGPDNMLFLDGADMLFLDASFMEFLGS
jgi:hypothetical protein